MIRTPEALAAFIERALQAECIGLDTEFVWERTFYPALGLVQAALSAEEVFLIDVPAVGDISPLGRLLADPRVVKVLHDAQQDLTILRRATGAFPRNIFDTRLAAGFIGMSSTVSLEELLRELMGIRLPKTETRTDWLRRPLSERQIAYAMDDVRYLPLLRQRILSRAGSRKAWIEEESAIYDDSALYRDSDPREQFRRIKGAGRLPPAKRAVLRELAAWREREAQTRDLPRLWIISDEMLLSMAKHAPRTPEEVRRIKGLSEMEAEAYGSAIVRAIRNALDLPREEWPREETHFREDNGMGARIDLVQAFMKGKCLAEGIDPALAASRAEIAALVQEGARTDYRRHRLLRGWRLDFIGREILKLLEGEIAVRLDPGSGLPVGNITRSER